MTPFGNLPGKAGEILGCSRGVKFVYGAAKSGKIKPRIERIFPFEDFREAFGTLRTGPLRPASPQTNTFSICLNHGTTLGAVR